MKKYSLFKQFKLFLYYAKIINSIEKELFTKLGFRVDDAYRLYTVIKIEENLMSPYLENALQKAMQDTHKNLSDFLNSKGLMEYYTYYSDEFKKIDLNNYLIVYGLSIFRTDVAIDKFFNYLKMSSVFVAAILILILILQYISNF